MKKKQHDVVRKTEIILKEKEKNWYISPCTGIPEYNTDLDANCPSAQLKKYNEQNKLKAKILARNDKITEKYVKSSLQPSMDDISANLNNNFRSKINKMNGGDKMRSKESLAEVEILQKIVVRENLLAELHKLLRIQSDVSACINEVVELVKAIRFQTLDVIEEINLWQQVQPSARPFQFKGFNYLVKIKCDMDFLDLYDDIVQRFCFEFKSNPLAYRGGGNIITGYEFDKKVFKEGLLHSYYTSKDDEFLDGLPLERLHNAEKVIQNEFNRLSKEKGMSSSSSDQTTTGKIDALDREVFRAMQRSFTLLNESVSSSNLPPLKHSDEVVSSGSDIGVHKKAGVTAGSGASAGKSLRASKSGSVFNPRKVKQERILALTEEANELKAMMVHLEEKISFLGEHHEALLNRRTQLEGRMRDARSMGKEVAAQHISAEISVNAALILENTSKIKDLQREVYFISLERRRKQGTASKIKEELQDSKRREALQKKIAAKIKKDGLLAALEQFGRKSTNANAAADDVDDRRVDDKKSSKKKSLISSVDNDDKGNGIASSSSSSSDGLDVNKSNDSGKVRSLVPHNSSSSSSSSIIGEHNPLLLPSEQLQVASPTARRHVRISLSPHEHGWDSTLDGGCSDLPDQSYDPHNKHGRNEVIDEDEEEEYDQQDDELMMGAVSPLKDSDDPLTMDDDDDAYQSHYSDGHGGHYDSTYSTGDDELYDDDGDGSHGDGEESPLGFSYASLSPPPLSIGHSESNKASASANRTQSSSSSSAATHAANVTDNRLYISDDED